MLVLRLIMTHCINRDQPRLGVVSTVCTRQGFNIQSDFYLAHSYEKGREAVAAQLRGSLPLSPVQGIYHPKHGTMLRVINNVILPLISCKNSSCHAQRRGSKIRIRYKVTPLELGGIQCLVQGHLNRLGACRPPEL